MTIHITISQDINASVTTGELSNDYDMYACTYIMSTFSTKVRYINEIVKVSQLKASYQKM